MTQKGKVNLETVRLFAENNVISHKDATLYHSGEKGTDFFDIDRLVGERSNQRSVLELVIEGVNELEDSGLQYDKIAVVHKDSGPVGLVIYASELSRRLDKELTIVKRWDKFRFDELKTKGSKIEKDDRVLVLDDVITTGSTQRRVIDAITHHNGRVSGLLSIFTRDQEVEKELKEEYEINHTNSLFTHEDFEYLGLTLPNSAESYFDSDFAEKYTELIGEDRSRKRDIDEKLDSIIEEQLESSGKNLEEEEAREGLKNLYLNISMFIHQKDLYQNPSNEVKR